MKNQKLETLWSASYENAKEYTTCLHNIAESAIFELLEDIERHEYPDFVMLYVFTMDMNTTNTDGIEFVYKTKVCIKSMRR